MRRVVEPAVVRFYQWRGDPVALWMHPRTKLSPYGLYEEIRSRGLVRSGLGACATVSHATAERILRDRRFSASPNHQRGYKPPVYPEGDPRAKLPNESMLFMDPPDHTRLRGLVSQAFTPKMVERLRFRIHEIVDERLDAVVARGDGHMDVVTELAYPLPVVIICELLGVPAEDHATFQSWSSELAASIDPDPLITPEQRERIEAAGNAFLEYFAELIERRRRSLSDDLLSALIEAEEGGDRLTEEELLGTGLFLLIAGHETTVNLIGNGTLALLQHRDQLERLRDDPSLDRRGVEELLRFDSPVQLTQRITLDDYDVGDVTIPKGQNLIPLLGAANHDPDEFEEPDHLDLGRENANRHLAFGGGHHFCLGASLARLEGAVAIGTLVRRFPDIELAGDPVRKTTFTLRGLTHLPVALAG
jgi:cytochrome P450